MTSEPTTVSYNLTAIQDAFTGESLGALDISVIIAYFLGVLAVGLWSMYRTNRSTVGGYFLAGRSISWWPVGASLFSSNVGSGHFVGLAGSGAASGIAVGAYEWNAMFIVLVLAWVFLPVYIASGVVTMPEYLKKRFGGQRLQICIAVLTLFMYIFTKISVDLYAGAIFIHEALKWQLYPSVILLLGITAFYTIGGGLAAVIYTDTMQTVIIIFGAFALMIVGFVNIGGYVGLVEKYMDATPKYTLLSHPDCGVPRNDSFHVFRSITNEEFPWTGVVFGMPLLSIWYWCSDQVIVQRTLASKDLTHAKGGAILCSYLKVLPMFMMVMVGMMSRANFPDQVGCIVPEICSKVCGNPDSCSDIAYPKMVMEYLPTGGRGLMMSVLLAALMSSLTSTFNSSSTIFTIDLWQKARPKASERELMIVGRIFVAVLIVLSVAWIPVIQIQEGGQLFTYIQRISSYFQPPIAICFLLAVFWKRTSEPAAFWGVVIGVIIGIVKLILDFTNPHPGCGQPDLRPAVVGKVQYLHFAIILGLISALIMIVISLFYPSSSESQYAGLTWWTRGEVSSPTTKTERSALVSDDETALRYDDSVNDVEPVHKENTTNNSNNDNDLGQPDVVPRFELPTASSYNASNNTVEFTEPQETDHNTEEAQEESRPLWKRVFSFICGLEYSDKSKSSYIDQNMAIQTLEEDPFWRKVVNINMIFCVLFAVIMYIVFR